METYIGTKVIRALPMTRQDYNDFRNWVLPDDENGDDEGYLVEYMDGGQRNTEAYQGYVSWSPKDVFERSYRRIDGLTFGGAVEALKLGMKVARRGWNGKGMWLTFVGAAQWQISEDVAGMDDQSLLTLPWIGMRTADSRFVPWLASQTDMLAEDWMLVSP